MTPGLSALDSIVICDNSSDQQAPSVTYGGGVFLVSWLDKREPYPAIYSARVLPDGSVIENNGFLLHADSMNQVSPVSAFDGNNFMVAWIGFDPGGYGVFAKRVSPVGVVLDPLPIEICYDSTAKYNPAISFDGNNFLVIWDDARLTGSEFDEWCARISTDGDVLDTNCIAVDTSSGYQYTPSVAYLDPYFLAVWIDDQFGASDLVGKRIDTNGDVVDTIALVISDASGVQMNPVAFPGVDRYVVAWEDGRYGYEFKDIYGEFVDSAGAGLMEGIHQEKDCSNPTLLVKPNPFSREIEIRWEAVAGSRGVEVRIFDICGRVVRSRRFHPRFGKTKNSFIWDARDNAGNEVSAGIYFCAVCVGQNKLTRRIVLLK